MSTSPITDLVASLLEKTIVCISYVTVVKIVKLTDALHLIEQTGATSDLKVELTAIMNTFKAMSIEFVDEKTIGIDGIIEQIWNEVHGEKKFAPLTIIVHKMVKGATDSGFFTQNFVKLANDHIQKLSDEEKKLSPNLSLKDTLYSTMTSLMTMGLQLTNQDTPSSFNDLVDEIWYQVYWKVENTMTTPLTRSVYDTVDHAKLSPLRVCSKRDKMFAIFEVLANKEKLLCFKTNEEEIREALEEAMISLSQIDILWGYQGSFYIYLDAAYDRAYKMC
jgi:hypothetical protein